MTPLTLWSTKCLHWPHFYQLSACTTQTHRGLCLRQKNTYNSEPLENQYALLGILHCKCKMLNLVLYIKLNQRYSPSEEVPALSRRGIRIL